GAVRHDSCLCGGLSETRTAELLLLWNYCCLASSGPVSWVIRWWCTSVDRSRSLFAPAFRISEDFLTSYSGTVLPPRDPTSGILSPRPSLPRNIHSDSFWIGARRAKLGNSNDRRVGSYDLSLRSGHSARFACQLRRGSRRVVATALV